jgi:anti-sigma factor RsiW
MTFLRRRFACADVVEVVTDYLEGALSRSDRRRFEAHLAGCPDCTEYLRQMQTMISLTGQLGIVELSPQLRQEFRALFQKWKVEQVDR